MPTIVLLTSFVVVFFPALFVSCLILVRRDRIYKATEANRREKNGHHLATAVLALIGLGLLLIGVQVEVMNHSILWVLCFFIGIFLIPIRIFTTELGIRSRR